MNTFSQRSEPRQRLPTAVYAPRVLREANPRSSADAQYKNLASSEVFFSWRRRSYNMLWVVGMTRLISCWNDEAHNLLE